MALIKGTSGADKLVGGAGNDTLQGAAGNDTLTGGAGNDLLQGGTGNNTYVLSLGDGRDTISSLLDTSANKFSTLVLDRGIHVTDQNFQRVGNDLVLNYSVDDAVTIRDFFTPGLSPIQKIKSTSDGDSWDLMRLLGSANGLRIDASFDGSSGDVKLYGSNFNDTLSGGYGNDTIIGGNGDDHLSGSYGDDLADGGAGNDLLSGDYGNDTLIGGSGNDTLEGGFDSAVMQGGAGNDRITANYGVNTIDGGADNDTIVNNDSLPDSTTILFGKVDGNDVIQGQGEGVLRFKSGVATTDVTARRRQDDLLIQVGSGDSVTVRDFFKSDGNGGNMGPVQTLTFTDNKTSWDAAALLARIASNNKTLNGTAGKDTLRGGATDDLINGDNGNDSLLGGAGFDTLVGGAGVDTLVGGTGDDTYVIDSAADVIVENANEGNDTVVLNGYSYSLNTTKLANVDNISATTNVAATYSGNALSNRIEVTGTGASRLSGLAGDDTLQGGAGNDTLDGGTGNNVYVFGKGSGQDVIVASADASATKYNTVQFTPDVGYNQVKFQQLGNDLKVSLDGSSDSLTIQNFFSGNNPGNATNPVQAFVVDGWVGPTFTAQQVQDIVLQGNDTIAGTAQADGLRGGAGNDSLSGLAGNDTLDGGTGNDTLNGGTGNNVYLYGKGEFGLQDGRDIIEASQDTSTTKLNTLKFKAGIDVNDVKFRRSGNDLMLKCSATDSVTVKGFFANGGPSNLSNPIQQVTFTDGNVTLTAAQIAQLALPANPAIVGTAGDDSLYGDYDDDSIAGGDGNDLIDGGGGNDTLSGGRGNDTLQGGANLIGGEGDDTYVVDNTDAVHITEAAGQGSDTIIVTVHDSGPGTAKFSLNTPELANIENLALGAYIGPLGGQYASLEGNAGDNVLSASGSLGSVALYGLDGNDTLSGLFRGMNTMVGGKGNDTYLVSYRDNIGAIVEQADEGIDSIDMEGIFNGHYTLDSASGANVENLLFRGDAMGGYAINGNQLDNTITVGFARGNTFDGKAGADTYALGGGSGTFVFDDMGDRAQVTNALNGFVIQSSVSVDLRQQGNVTQALLTGNANNQLTGTDAADVLTGNDGNNLLIGGVGNDTLSGGIGADLLQGDAGNNTYQYGLGDGNDTISAGINPAAGAVNTLALKPGVASSTLSASRNGNDLVLKVSSTDSITLRQFFASGNGINAAGPIQAVTFAESGEVWDAARLASLVLPPVNKIIGTSGNDRLAATNSNDDVQGLGGNDNLVGYGGNDTLTGGQGNDTLEGRDGNDVYQYGLGDGDDLISRWNREVLPAGEVNTLNFLSGVTPDMLTASRSGMDLILKLKGGGSITLQDFIATVGGADASAPIQQVHFADSDTTLDAAQLAKLVPVPTSGATLVGTANSERLLGTAADDTADGLGADDALLGLEGNDTLTGGSGNDQLSGGIGDDTYRFGVGDGQDVILAETGTAGGELNTLSFNAGVLPSMVSAYRNGNNVTLRYGVSDIVNIEQFYTDTGAVHTQGSFQRVIFSGTGETWDAAKLVSLISQTPYENLISGGSGNDSLSGTAFNDLIQGLAGDDTLTGSGGTDTLDGGAGNDWLRGGGVALFGLGDGMDTTGDGGFPPTADGKYSIKFKTGVTESMVKLTRVGADLVATISPTDQITVRNVYDFFGTDRLVNPVSISFTDSGVVWDGQQVDALIRPLVTTTGTSKNDTLTVDPNARNVLVGGAGNDTYNIGQNRFTTTIVEAPDGGIDTVQVIGRLSLDSPAFANVENVIQTVDSSAGIPFAGSLTGNALDNYLSGSSPYGTPLTIYGLDGNDTITGSTQAAYFYGGQGNDTYILTDFRSVELTEMPGEGIDTIIDHSKYAIYEDAILPANSNIENLDCRDWSPFSGYIGNEMDNVIWGIGGALDARRTRFVGGAGADTYHVTGVNSCDYQLDNVGDRIIWDSAPTASTSGFGGEIHASVSVDLQQQPYVNTLTMTGSDNIAGSGTAQADQITGNAGDNAINGRQGNDTLAGGAGNDTYTYQWGDGSDVITDVGGALDTLVLQDAALGQVGYAQVGQDLKLSFTGSADTITVANWFASTDNQLEAIRTSAGVVSNQQVNALLQAMVTAPAAASVPAAGSLNTTTVQQSLLTV